MFPEESPVDQQRIAVRHLSEAVEGRVREWFAGTIADARRDGARSVRVAHPERDGFDLKIKGAGFRGGPIRFGELRQTGPRQPVFDFDGRMMENVAAGHDNAYQGGASFQQAANEFRVTAILAGFGIPVVPCVGYGRIDQGEATAWFAVFEYDRAWNDKVVVPHVSIEEFAEANLRVGQVLLDLALARDLIGYCWFVGAPAGSYLMKDVHPFRLADPVNMSQLSWVMQLIFGIHILCLAAAHFPRAAKSQNVPEDLQAYPFRAVLPTATKADHDQLRFSVVARYMLRPPEHFDPGELLAALRRNPISSALLDLCPERFVRY